MILIGKGQIGQNFCQSWASERAALLKQPKIITDKNLVCNIHHNEKIKYVV